MSISYDREKINKILEMVLILLLLLAFVYALGIISSSEKNRSPVTISYPANALSSEQNVMTGTATDTKIIPTTVEPARVTSGYVVASKNGTKYHLPTCPGAATILPQNKIMFKNSIEAEKAGYSPAKNCKGLNIK